MNEEEYSTFRKKVRSSGRVTIPQEYRDTLDIDEGDIVEVKIKKVDTD